MMKEALNMTAIGRMYEQEREQDANYRVAKAYVNLVERCTNKVSQRQKLVQR